MNRSNTITEKLHLLCFFGLGLLRFLGSTRLTVVSSSAGVSGASHHGSICESCLASFSIKFQVNLKIFRSNIAIGSDSFGLLKIRPGINFSVVVVSVEVCMNVVLTLSYII